MARGQRITNGQRAAVCGLVIAGVSLGAACRIACVPYRAMKALLPGDWRTQRAGKPTRWTDAKLAELKAAWMGPGTSEDIGRRFHIDASRARQIARAHGWPPRRSGRPCEPNSVRAMPAKTRRLYLKMRRSMPRDQALAAVGVSP